MNSAGSVVVDIDGNNDGLVRTIDDSMGRLKNFGRRARVTANRLGGIAAASAGAGAALSAHVVAQSARAADELKTLAAQARTTPAELQRMSAATKQVGIDQNDLSDILKDTQDRVGDFVATGAGPMADFFEKIAPQVGVTAEQFQKLSGPQSLQLFVDSLEKANVSQSEMTFYMEALSSESTKLLPLLRNGGKAMAEQTREMDKLNATLTNMEVERLDQLSTTMTEGAEMADIFGKKFSAELAPSLQAVSKYIKQVIVGSGGMGNAASKAADVIAGAMGFVGDTIRGVQVVIKTLKLATQGAALAMVQGFTNTAKAIDLVVSGVEDRINAVIGGLNNLPNVDIPQIDIPTEGLVKGLEGTRNQLVSDVEATKDELHDLLMEELPSDALDRMTEDAKKKMDEAARQAIDNMNEVNANGEGSGTGGADSGSGDDDDKDKTPAERIAEQNQKKLEQIRKGYEQEFLAKQEFEQRKLALDKMYNEQGLLTEQQYNQARFQSMQKYTQKELGMKSSGYEAMNQVVAKNMGAEEATVVNALGSIVNSTAKHSKEAFRIQQAAGIANAIVSTYTGAAKALELGWPVGPPAAAAIIANGFAKVAKIRSQSFSGGSSGGGGAGGGGGGGGSVGGGMNTNASGGGRVGEDGGDSPRRMYLHGVERGKDYDGHQIIDAIKTARQEGAILDIGDE